MKSILPIIWDLAMYSIMIRKQLGIEQGGWERLMEVWYNVSNPTLLITNQETYLTINTVTIRCPL